MDDPSDIKTIGLPLVLSTLLFSVVSLYLHIVQFATILTARLADTDGRMLNTKVIDFPMAFVTRLIRTYNLKV